MPATKQSIYADANKQITDANSKMAAEVTRVQGLEDQITEYQAKVDEAQNTMKEAEDKAASYEDLLKASSLLIGGDQSAAAAALEKIEADTLDGAGKDLYNTIQENVKSLMYNNYKNAGDVAYVARTTAQLQKIMTRQPRTIRTIMKHSRCWECPIYQGVDGQCRRRI